MKYKIGIIGFGFVGSAVAQGFSTLADIKIYDADPVKSENTLEEVCKESEFIFICVPTPIAEDMSCDTTIVEKVIKDCSPYVHDTNKILIIKSTIPPGTTEFIKKLYPDIRIVFNPEFLTARCARLDFINSARIVLGGDPEDLCEVEKLYRKKFPHTPIFWTDSTSAEMVKYTANCFFSVKVMFFNEIYQICEKLGIDYDEVKKMVLADGRIGNSHLDVPGHDGDFGIGGTCFPKDLNALMCKAIELGVSPNLLMAAWEKNLEVRKNRDWEK